MPAILVLSPLTDRGRALIDQLERETGERPLTVDQGTGDRTYYLSDGRSGVDAFDGMLDRIGPGWRNHIARTARERVPRFSRVLHPPAPTDDPLRHRR